MENFVISDVTYAKDAIIGDLRKMLDNSFSLEDGESFSRGSFRVSIHNGDKKVL